MTHDELHELKIHDACKKGIDCGLTDPELARMYFEAMAMLIAERSQEQVDRMEALKGLHSQ
jgi:hypothetical protein